MSMAAGYEVDWNLVRTFVSVVETGSLSGAARALELAHPTVARHVQQLESQLGVALFDRSASGLALNDAGQRLADVAIRMRHEARTLESVGESVRSETTGRVRITIADVLADLVPELLAPLKELEGAEARYIELIVSRERLNLLEREADVAIRHMRPEQTELVCRKLGAMPMGAWASAAYLERFGLPSMDTLDGHRFIDGLSTRAFTLALERLGHKVPDSQVSFRTDCLQSQRRAAELGQDPVLRDAPVRRRLAPRARHLRQRGRQDHARRHGHRLRQGRVPDGLRAPGGVSARHDGLPCERYVTHTSVPPNGP